jgi:hypothetical protein
MLSLHTADGGLPVELLLGAHLVDNPSCVLLLEPRCLNNLPH